MPDRKEYLHQHYLDNRENYYASRDRHKAAIRRWFVEYKRKQSCKICGESCPSCLDFHHRDPEQKEFSMRHMVMGGYGLARIKEEIVKCDVLCANCHRKLHAGVFDKKPFS